MASETGKRATFGVLTLLILGVLVAIAVVLSQQSADAPAGDPSPGVTDPTKTEYPAPLDPSLPPMGEDPGNPSHGPVQPTDEK